ncbi:hypothetical protein DFH28DRAFT_1130679 [Melampsora americana]|nr:hypothetical protein DFH28DRAFT_1130679 [Melampsora americana]
MDATMNNHAAPNPNATNMAAIIADALKQQVSQFETIVGTLQTQISNLKSLTSKSPKTPKTPTLIRKKHPLQLTVEDTPLDFKSGKEALYVHIKMMWGLYKQSDVPPPPNKALLTEFYGKFNAPAKVKSVVNNPSSNDLIAWDSILSLKEFCASGGKMACGMGHIDQMSILYMSGILAKVGIRAWAPDLEDAPNSLYNSAC